MKVLNFSRLISLLLFSTAFIFITGCEKDDPDGFASIIGTWTSSESTIDVTIDGISFVDYLVDQMGMSSETADAFLAEMSDNSTPTGSVEFKEDGIFTSDWEDSEPELGAWTLEGDVLSITVDGSTEEMVFKVLTLTASQLTIENSMTEFEDMNQDGTEEEMIIKSQMGFTR